MASNKLAQSESHVHQSSTKKPLSVWELSKLLRSVRSHRKTTTKVARERPHFRGILAFVHRNRFAVASQILRRFPKHLGSDRTARRHLAEMESLGLLGVVETNNVSPLWPKVFFVTRRGMATLKKALHKQGKEWTESVQDRRRSDGASAQHVLHELFITEFQLMAWETTQVLDDLQFLTMQRRSLAKHDAFKIVVAGRQIRLQPDAMFLYRQQGRGMMCCFVEMDLDSMSNKQLVAKFRRYQRWAESSKSSQYLEELYVRYGATKPAARFRILVVVGSRTIQAEQQRVTRIAKLASGLPKTISDCIWISSVNQLQVATERSAILNESLWIRPRDVS